MREALAARNGQRLQVQATVVRLSMRIGWGVVREPTILLGPVATVDGEPLCDHLWMPVGRRLAALDLQPGDMVRFSARVATYRRGLYRLPGEAAQFTIDYGLSYPTRCTVVARAPEPVPAPTPEPKPMPAVVPARTRILAALDALWSEAGEPPSLSHLFAQAGVGPVAFLKHVQKLARAGVVALSPEGRLSLPATLEGSSQP